MFNQNKQMVYATTYVLVCDTHKFASMHTLSYTSNMSPARNKNSYKMCSNHVSHALVGLTGDEADELRHTPGFAPLLRQRPWHGEGAPGASRRPHSWSASAGPAHRSPAARLLLLPWECCGCVCRFRVLCACTTGVLNRKVASQLGCCHADGLSCWDASFVY
jgi:hypothetical protein